MKFTTYAPCTSTEEVIIASKEFSSLGTITLQEALSQTKEMAVLGKRVLFDWDILMTEQVLAKLKKIFFQMDTSSIHAVRIKDKGAVQFFLEENFPQKIHLNLEKSDHNETGILYWANVLGKKLERIILSQEIDKINLEKYIPKISQLSKQTEILGLGPISLFYTPRKLLSAQFQTKSPSSEALVASGFDEENIHREFSFIENAQGTFMFHPKDLNLLDQVDYLRKIGLSTLRIDIRHIKPHQQKTILDTLTRGNKNIYYPRPCIKGFFNANRSNTLFKKLKNSRTVDKDEHFLGEIYDMKQRHYMGLFCLSDRPVKVNDILKIVTPDGIEKKIKISWLKDALGRNVDKTAQNRLFYMNPVSSISVKSSVFRCD